MNYTFKGIDSSTMGVTVITQPQFKTAELRMTFIDIDGRDGSITYPSGYNYYSTEMTIAIEDFDRLEEIRGWMTGSGLYIRSDNPDRYIKVTIDGTIDYTHLQFGIHTAVITLNVYDPFWYKILNDPYFEVTTEIVNEGNIYSKPMIRISYEGSQQKELRMTIGNTQMIYNWPTNENEVEYDTSTGYSYHKGQRRDRHWHIDMAPFELPIGETKVVKETRYDTKVEVMEESRWR